MAAATSTFDARTSSCVAARPRASLAPSAGRRCQVAGGRAPPRPEPVSYTHLRAHETSAHL
eukprot:11178926-Alexandrium_andersonii.AAC.1